jgi:hypothetical protein
MQEGVFTGAILRLFSFAPGRFAFRVFVCVKEKDSPRRREDHEEEERMGKKKTRTSRELLKFLLPNILRDLCVFAVKSPSGP